MSKEVTLDRLMRQAELHVLHGRRPKQSGEWLRVFRWIAGCLAAGSEADLWRMVDVIVCQYPHALIAADLDKMVRKEWRRRVRISRRKER